MIIEEEVYLEHHGIKGMHWGTRQEETKKNLTPVSSLTSEQKVERNKGRLKVAAIGYGLITAAILFLAARGGMFGTATSTFVDKEFAQVSKKTIKNAINTTGREVINTKNGEAFARKMLNP